MAKSGQTHTGDGVEYSYPEEAELEASAEEAWLDEFGEDLSDEFGLSGSSGSLVVTAQVEWAGSTQRSNDGMRTVRLDGVDLARIGNSLRESRQARQRAAEAQPARSYRAKGWHAQISALTRSKRGSELADRAGLDVTPRTLRAWLSEDRPPSKRNRDLIAQAYDGLGTYNVERAATQGRESTHRTAQAITDAIQDRYGATVRFRDIRGFRFES